ncbi:TctC citrate transporter [Pseudonocardia sp. Ae168_Ps1]|uniref:Bug family tripartite tricarboxylate transporter substrate binding protein n=1 Tax=unclassified Pseudonocardia TaxID=2619320 RepID=UPI00094AD157|nr:MULTISPECIES: tripartite tricarboxylate transporter substrate binding protein [unclassified Pseudonocardia]OLL76199.1 Tc [Pseudonocardia sp. Ae150A_Ps1]OLL82199.1 TctC citrate transporter [Pseudonocardia sp. Ae168_Ps1]OLL83686.1 TctC citrate transporter [Pseudonocardia sp. Ae263_Ps1]OLL90273.1 TctC citrate transporter [Pseudonocardia sp. Ae356_Ps1]
MTDTATGGPARPSRRAFCAGLAAGLAALATGAAAGCGGPEPVRGLRFLVPNAPGGGYDVTARSAAKALSDAGITGPAEVFSLPGAGGIAGLGRVVNEAGNDRLVLSIGLGLVGAARSADATGLLTAATPLARLTRETEIVVVARDSPFRDLPQLLAAWRADPAGNAVGGGSSTGGPDHLATMLVAEGAGVPPRRVGYVPHDGGGELLASLLADEVTFGVSGLGEFADQIASGALRTLAITAGEPIPGVGAPTLREAGIDLEVTNWRGILAPPGLTPGQVGGLDDCFAAMVRTPQWQDVLRRNNWQDAYLPGPEFGTFLRSEDERVGRVLTGLGLG